MEITFTIKASATDSEGWVVKVWEASNDTPGAEVYTSATIPGPHTAGDDVIVTGLDAVPHLIRVYGATTSALKAGPWIQMPVQNVATYYNPIQFRIGDGGTYTPVADSDTLTHPDLFGLSDADYTLFKNGFGFLIVNEHYQTDPINGIAVLIDGSKFELDTYWTLQKKPLVITTPINDSVVGKKYAGFFNIVANVNYSNTHLRKLLRFTGAFEYTFPVGSGVPIGYPFSFTNFNSNGATGKVNFQNAALTWGTTTKTSIDIPPYCQGSFVFDGTNWNVDYLPNSAWANGQSVLPGDYLGGGEFFVGDVAGGDPVYEIIHNLDITGDYIVVPTLLTGPSGNMAANNKVGMTWKHHATQKKDKFYVSLQEITSEVQQDLRIRWHILKA